MPRVTWEWDAMCDMGSDVMHGHRVGCHVGCYVRQRMGCHVGYRVGCHD